jgi:peptidoglycan/LPS O-acetylase OafA/YrhL
MIPPPTRGEQPARVDELDGLRGLLALWVVLGHMLAWSGYWENKLPPGFGVCWTAFVGGHAAVDTFIILSGFAITFLLCKRSQSYLGFMTGRFFRIYPVYLPCLLLGIATTFLTPHILDTAQWRGTAYFEGIRTVTQDSFSAPGAHTFWHLTLLNGVLPKSFLTSATVTLLPPAWSITLEWQYYLVAPFLARMVLPTSSRLRTAANWAVIAAIGLVGLRYRGEWQNPMAAFFPSRMPLFLIGIWSYHFYARFHGTSNGRRIALVAVAVTVAASILRQWNPIALTAWALGLGCVMVPGNPLLSLVRRTLLHPALQWLGHISFPVYLIHWPVIIGVLAVQLHFVPGISQGKALAVLLFAGLPLVILAARLLHVFVETPGIAFGKKASCRSAPAVARPGAAPGN